LTIHAFWALPPARVFRYIFFFKKDAAAPANAGVATNKVRRSRRWLHGSPRLPPARQAPVAFGPPRCPHATLLVNPSARITQGTCFSPI